MKEASIQKAFELIKKFGDRCIIIDNPSNHAYVVMTLEEYESLMGKHEEISQLTEKEFLDRINREIAIWKTVQEDESFSDWEFAPIKKESEAKDMEKDAGDEVYYFEPID